MNGDVRGDDPVRLLMSQPVVVADQEATLREVAMLLRDESVGAVVIPGRTGAAGIVSERDVVRALADGADPDTTWAVDVMSEKPVFLAPDDSVAEARRLMLDGGIRHLPVLDGDDVVGVVSLRDVAAVPG